MVNDPNPYFDHLRSKCPVLREPHHGAMMVTGYAEAMGVPEEDREEILELLGSPPTHGSPDARRFQYEPTYLLRGLSALHIEFHAASGT